MVISTEFGLLYRLFVCLYCSLGIPKVSKHTGTASTYGDPSRPVEKGRGQITEITEEIKWAEEIVE